MGDTLIQRCYIKTLAEWLRNNDGQRIITLFEVMYDWRYADVSRQWFEIFVDRHGGMLLLMRGASIIGASNWRFPSPERLRNGTVFGDIGIVPGHQTNEGCLLLASRTVEELRIAVARQQRLDIRSARFHVRVDDRRLQDACAEAGFNIGTILMNRHEDFGSLVETRMIDLYFSPSQ